MTAIRVTESSGSIGVLQISDGTGGFSPSNLLFSTGSSGIAKSILLGSDVAVFISGATNSKNTARAGAALFGGDVVISGTLYAERQVIEVDELVDGDLLVTGSLVTSQGATIGSTLTIEGSLKSSTSKLLILSGGAALSTDEGEYSDVNFFVSGSKGSAGTSTRGTTLFGGDVVISGTLHGGSPLKIAGGMEVAGAADFAGAMNFAAAPTFAAGFVVTGSTAYDTASSFDGGLSGSLTRLPDGTSFIEQSGAVTVSSASGGAITVASPSHVFSEFIGLSNGSNTKFTLNYQPNNVKNISIFVNGIFQAPATSITSAGYQDYSVTGSNVYFTTASLPESGSVIFANYSTNNDIS